MNKKLSAKIKSLPQKPGAYLFKDVSGRLLYIGKAVKLRNRVRAHFEFLSPAKNDILIQRPLSAGERNETPHRKPRSPKVSFGLSGAGWPEKVADIDFITTTDEKEALILENQLIKKYKPKYNIQWCDDKSYFWVSFSSDEWPRVKTTHQPSLRAQRSNPADGNNSSGLLRRYAPRNDSFIGPFTNGRELKQVLRAWRKILPYRTCKNRYDKPCLQWHLNLCPAHRSVKPLKSDFKGSPKSDFSGSKDFTRQLNTYHLSLNTLRQLLRLYAGQPLRIEAYDISNIQGTNATGSMIVFKGFKPDKSAYRKFKIKTVRSANDVAMLKEVLRRRLGHLEWPLPDLMLIDGGRPQLNAANLSLNTYHLSLPLLALAKKEEELYTIYSPKVLRLSSLPSDLRLLFQAIRDEAHRFAISYYRKLHRKRIRTR